MEEQEFDQQLKQAILTVFDRYEDDSANEGWALLNKTNEKRRRLFPFWWLTAGSAFLLIASCWFWWPVRQLYAVKTSTGKSQLSLAVKANVPEPQLVKHKTTPSRQAVNNLNPKPATALSPSSSPGNGLSVSHHYPMGNEPFSLPEPDSIERFPVAMERPLLPVEIEEAAGTLHLPIVPVFLQDSSRTTKHTRKWQFSLQVNTYLNFGSGGRLRPGAGLSATGGWPLSRKWEAFAGLSVRQDRYESRAGNRGNLVYASPPSSSGTSFVSSSSDPLRANLLALAIPIGWKFTPGTNQHPIFFGLGISSGFFLREAYTGIPAGTTSGGSAATTNSTSYFSRFHFARTLDFSVGWQYPAGFHVSPFVNYPLGKVGSQQLRVGAAGASFRWEFGRK